MRGEREDDDSKLENDASITKMKRKRGKGVREDNLTIRKDESREQVGRR